MPFSGELYRQLPQPELQAHDGLQVVGGQVSDVEAGLRRQGGRRRLHRDVPPLQLRQRHLRTNAETITRL